MDDVKHLDDFDPEDPDDPGGDLRTLHHLEQAGGDLTKETNFRHVLYFGDEAPARRAAETLSGDYRVDVLPPDDDEDTWAVLAENEAVPAIENVRAMRRAMEAAAAEGGGDYDGWEAGVQA